MKNTYLLFAVLLLLWVGYKLFNYGSIFRSCEYTEASMIAPEDLKYGKISLFKNAFIANGFDPDIECLPSLGKMTTEIVGPETISNLTIGRKYFESRGRTITDLKLGSKEFRLKGMLSVTKHGIGTVDSGPGPIDYLILIDDQSTEYKIATVELGINEEDRFLKLQSSKGDVVLSPQYFRRH